MSFTEAMLHKIRETVNPDDPLFGNRGENNLVNTLLNFFMAGSGTTAAALNWAMLYMILNPDIQDKVRRELDEATGVEQTPYTKAVICEIQRRGWHFFIGMPHKTSSTLKLKSYLNKFLVGLNFETFNVELIFFSC